MCVINCHLNITLSQTRPSNFIAVYEQILLSEGRYFQTFALRYLHLCAIFNTTSINVLVKY